MTHPHPLSNVEGSASASDSQSSSAAPLSLSEAERRVLLEEWTHGEGNYPSQPTLHALFAAQVQATPTHPACHYDGKTVTYQQLDEQITRLAAHLQSLLGSDQP